MKLYVCAIAPNPTKVRLYLAEKNSNGIVVDVSQVVVNLQKGEQREATHLARNPLGKLPVLELDDGTHLTESLAIIEYLEECFPNPTMLGNTPLERAKVRELERIAEFRVLQPIGRIIHATKSPLGLMPNPEIAAYFKNMLPGTLKVLNGRMSDGRKFVAGDTPTVADCTLAAAFEFARFGGWK